jgi:hypothetical protein
MQRRRKFEKTASLRKVKVETASAGVLAIAENAPICDRCCIGEKHRIAPCGLAVVERGCPRTSPSPSTACQTYNCLPVETAR